MLQSIEVKNYKILNSLKIKDFGELNFFIGKNNCGKSSVLEALSLGVNSNKIDILLEIYTSARKLIFNSETLPYLFYQLNTNNPIKIHTQSPKDESILEISTLQSDTSTQQISNDISISSSNKIAKNEFIKGLKFLESKNKAQEIASFIKFDGDTLRLITPKTSSKASLEMNFNSHSNLCASLLTGTTLASYTKNAIKQIKMSKQESKLKELLKIFDENIQGIDLIGNELLIDLKDFGRKISINTMGEGFARYLCIVATLIAQQEQYIFIDEIENGLHHESMKKLIQVMIKLSKKTQIQVFATTHSYEFLKLLSQSQNEKIAIFDISKTKKKDLQAYKYSTKDLANLIKNEVEFRD